MNYVKKIVCLANSRKHSGRCIAGKEVLPRGYGSWIRPISARPSAEISEEERRFENGKDPRVLDIIDVPMIAAVPLLHQTENHVIDAGYYWTKKGQLPWAELKHLIDKPAPLWFNGDSTYSGLNDRVSVEHAAKMTNSLMAGVFEFSTSSTIIHVCALVSSSIYRSREAGWFACSTNCVRRVGYPRRWCSTMVPR